MIRKILWLFAVLLLADVQLAQAQQPNKLRRIGLLMPGAPSPPGSPTPLDKGLSKLGYVEGQNIAIERRYANGQMNRFPELAADLARLSVDVILAGSFPAALAAKEATTIIPIVVFGAGDPVATGLVASFARPGKNITGVSAQEAELSGKRLELLTEVFPKLARSAVLWNGADLGMTLKSRAGASGAGVEGRCAGFGCPRAPGFCECFFRDDAYTARRAVGYHRSIDQKQSEAAF
jgi:putative tryptophan/tyrosine transport system substrate-binding protein